MIARIKNMIESRSMYSKILQANEHGVIKPFLLGCQMEYRRFSTYIFAKQTSANLNLLKDRHFKEFKESVGSRVNWTLTDDILSFGDSVMYNEKYNIMIVLVPEKLWNTLNTSINIAENTDQDAETQRDIVISAFKTLTI